MAFARRGPLLQDVGAPVGEVGQLLLDWMRWLTNLSPVLQRRIEAFEVRLEIGQAYFQTSSVRKHVSLGKLILVQAAPHENLFRLDLVLGT
jgi:hypothetical protein